MSLMSKLLTATLIASVSLSAAVPTEKELMKYVKRHVIKNRSVKINSIKVVEIKKVDELKGWEVLLTNISITVQDKEMDIPEMMFVNGDLITPVLMNHKNGKNYRNEIRPEIPQSYYDDAHLLMGDKDAKHKIVVFTDPMCPFCQEIMPEIFKAVKANPKTFALYYYHMPLLRLHPVSGPLTKAMHIAQEQGKIAEFEKFYAMKIDFKERNLDKIIPEIKKQTGLVVTKAQLEDKKLDEAMEADEKRATRLMITGTPTVYIDGKWDKMRDGYKKFIPKK
ncbi:MAG: thioredoxin domain-containing protein [Campylobacterales bacterium]|nr:thioredoxin domain-containing protein [Campylobacterales bacterium]